MYCIFGLSTVFWTRFFFSCMLYNYGWMLYIIEYTAIILQHATIIQSVGKWKSSSSLVSQNIYSTNNPQSIELCWYLKWEHTSLCLMQIGRQRAELFHFEDDKKHGTIKHYLIGNPTLRVRDLLRLWVFLTQSIRIDEIPRNQFTKSGGVLIFWFPIHLVSNHGTKGKTLKWTVPKVWCAYQTSLKYKQISTIIRCNNFCLFLCYENTYFID